MPQKKNKAAKWVGRKSRRNVSSGSNDEVQEDAHRSEADWLRLSKEILALKCNQSKLRTTGPKGDLAGRLVSFFTEQNRPRPSENDEEEEREHDNTELAEVAIQQPPEVSELLKSPTPGIENLIAQTLKVQEPPARPRRRAWKKRKR